MGGNPETARDHRRLVKQAELAYEFAPGSYTHSAMVTCAPPRAVASIWRGQHE